MSKQAEEKIVIGAVFFILISIILVPLFLFDSGHLITNLMTTSETIGLSLCLIISFLALPISHIVSEFILKCTGAYYE